MPWTDIENREQQNSVRAKLNALGQSAGGGGFMAYNNDGPPFAILADTWTPMPNDGLGPGTLKTFKPDDVTELLDVSTGELDTSELRLGDIVLVRNQFRVSPQVNGAYLQFRYSAGVAPGDFNLTRGIATLTDGSAIDYDLVFMDMIYMGSDNTKNNPIGLELKSSEAATILWTDTVIQVIRY